MKADYCEVCGEWIPLGSYADGSFDEVLQRYIYLCPVHHKEWCQKHYGDDDDIGCCMICGGTEKSRRRITQSDGTVVWYCSQQSCIDTAEEV